MALALLVAGIHVVLIITMARAQDRYLRRYREYHQVDLPLPHEGPLRVGALGLHSRTSKRIKRAYFEPQADPVLEQMRRRVVWYMKAIPCNMALIPLIFIVGLFWG